MVFEKSFPIKSDKSAYPKWVDVTLTKEEEASIDLSARKENLKLMRECLDDARVLADNPSDVTSIGIALFEKRASHSIYWKERKAKKKSKTLP